MADNAQASWPSPATPAHERLDVLAGEWIVDISHPLIPGPIPGRASFEWFEGGYFLVERSSVEHPDFPRGLSVIGQEDSTGQYVMHYFDSRGITRLYNMSLRDGVWTVWRDDPDFSQRFTGKFSDDGNTIAGYWEIAEDGTNWAHDFDLTYKKVK